MYIAKYHLTFIEIPDKISLSFWPFGCKHNCKGCCNKELQKFQTDKKYFIEIEEFENIIKNHLELIDAVVWLGGDAFFQYDRLLEFSKIVKKYNLINCIYTGFLFKDVQEKFNEILNYVDVIIDGKWEGKTIDNPETNQKIWMKNTKGKFVIINYQQFINIRSVKKC